MIAILVQGLIGLYEAFMPDVKPKVGDQHKKRLNW